MKLEEKLISLRKKQGLTQQELAGKLEVSRQAVSKWEVGLAVPNTENLKILSDLYNVPVDYLLNDEQEKPDTDEVPTEEKMTITRKRAERSECAHRFSLLYWPYC